jgi:hypothetical protein
MADNFQKNIMEYDYKTYAEDMKERFDDLVADKNWPAVSAMGVDLGERGFGELEKELIDSMDLQDLDEYTKWSRKENSGDDAWDELKDK